MSEPYGECLTGPCEEKMPHKTGSKIAFFLWILFFLSCTTGSHLHSAKSEFVFPDGTYQQKVMVEFRESDNADKKIFAFNAVLKKEQEKILIYSYNAFGMTLFKLTDEGFVQFESSIDEIQSRRDFFLKAYPSIKRILMMKKENSSLALERIQKEFSFKINLLYEAGWEIPAQVEIADPNRYKISIANTDYKSN